MMRAAIVIAVLGSAWAWSMWSALVAMQRADRAEHAQRVADEPLHGDTGGVAKDWAGTAGGTYNGNAALSTTIP